MKPRRVQHAEQARTKNDYRAELATFLTWARSLDNVTLETLVARYPKLPPAELARCLLDAKERRAANG